MSNIPAFNPVVAKLASVLQKGQPSLTESNLDDRRYQEGIGQLRSAVSARSLTKGEAGIHVMGSLVLKCFREDSWAFLLQLSNKLNNEVCFDFDHKFQVQHELGQEAVDVLERFAKDKNLRVLSAGWLELADRNKKVTDKRLLAVFQQVNGRRGVGVFQVTV